MGWIGHILCPRGLDWSHLCALMGWIGCPWCRCELDWAHFVSAWAGLVTLVSSWAGLDTLCVLAGWFGHTLCPCGLDLSTLCRHGLDWSHFVSFRGTLCVLVGWIGCPWCPCELMVWAHFVPSWAGLATLCVLMAWIQDWAHIVTLWAGSLGARGVLMGWIGADGINMITFEQGVDLLCILQYLPHHHISMSVVKH